MRGLLAVPGRKVGLIRPNGSLEISWTDPPAEDVLTFAGSHFVFTEQGFEGPYYPLLREEATGLPLPVDAWMEESMTLP